MGRKRWVSTLCFTLIFVGLLWPQAAGKSGLGRTAPDPAKDSLAWQIEELIKWLVQTRDLVPRPEACEPPCYVLERMDLEGSADKNRLRFVLLGGVIADRPVLVPVVGPPHRVILRSVTLNDRPAVVGFEKADHYYVRTDARRFVIRGEISLLNEMSFAVPGPVNLFNASLEDGRVVEGQRLPGLLNRTIHLELGRRGAVESTLPPVFQISRAVRIQKEITFEYRINVRSGGEISQVALPLPHGEMVLDIPGIRGWKQEGDRLIVPASGRQVQFSVFGRLPRVTPFHPEPRSDYEWWLIESDVEHRVDVRTAGRQVDSSESPIPKTLASGKLFLLARDQAIELTVKPLATLEALAVVIPGQTRQVIWTREGDLVAEDTIHYRNNGVDYVPLDCRGKAIYLEVDGQAQKILSDDPENENQVLVPMQKGTHRVLVQSISKHKPSLFGGLLRVPNAAHGLTISRASVGLGFPDRIIPLWFSGGEGVRSPLGWADLVALLLALGLALVFFQTRRLRLAGFVALAGLYFLLPALFFALLVLSLAVPLARLLWRRLEGWKRWVGLGAAGALLLVIVLVVLSAPAAMAPSPAGSGRIYGDDQAAVPELKSKMEADEEASYGQRAAPQQQTTQNLGNIAFLGKNVIEGVTPVRLPLPGYDGRVSVSRQLVTPERPLAPTLVYVTRTALLPLLLIWLFCAAVILWSLMPRFRTWWRQGKELLQTKG